MGAGVLKSAIDDVIDSAVKGYDNVDTLKACASGAIAGEVERFDKIIRALERKVVSLKRDRGSLEETVDRERHEFKRKQAGMSHLVTVLMDARFGESDEVYLGRDQFIRLGSEAAALRVDNQQLQDEVTRLRDKVLLVEAERSTHKIALQESTGDAIAKLVKERDDLKEELSSRAVELTVEDSDGQAYRKQLEDDMAYSQDMIEAELCDNLEMPGDKDIEREYRERLSAAAESSAEQTEKATKGQGVSIESGVHEVHGACAFSDMTDVDFHGGRPDGSRGSSGCRKQIEAAERVTEKEIVPLDEKNKVRLSSGEEPKIDCDFNESKVLVEVGTANDAEVGQILERCKNRWASGTVEFVPIRNGEVPGDCVSKGGAKDD